MTTRIIPLLAALAIAFANSFAPAQTISWIEFNLIPESVLWFEGTSSLHDFKCEAKNLDGVMKMDSLAFIKSAELLAGIVDGKVSIPVKSLESGKSEMNEKMFKALKEKEHPFIIYELMSAEMAETPERSSEWITLMTKGKLLVAGVERVIQMEVKCRRLSDNKIRFTGSKTLFMTDFGIKPPSMMMGVIKTGNEIVVHFDLVLMAESSAKPILD